MRSCSEDRPDIGCRTYAPVGSHRDLLAYLVRRLLENGANSSFVAVAADDAVPVATLLRRPADMIGTADNAQHPNMPPAARSLSAAAANSRGIEFGDRAALMSWSRLFAAETCTPDGGKHRRRDAGRRRMRRSSARARSGVQERWSRTPAQRAATAPCLEHAAELLEQRQAHFIALLQREGGKTLDDALSEVREAVDFCRYYAAEGRKLFGDGEPLPGPTGESNVLRLRGRGVFVAISPWNFPLAIFSGPGCGGADGRQCGGGKARRADAADRGGGRAAAA